MDVREKLVELITDKENDLVRKIAWLSDSCRIKEVANHLIAHGVTVQEWIPASEHPKDTCEYWIAYKSGGDYFYSTGYYDGKHWRSTITHNKIPVNYWMPLPETPKGE